MVHSIGMSVMEEKPAVTATMNAMHRALEFSSSECKSLLEFFSNPAACSTFSHLKSKDIMPKFTITGVY